MTWKVLFQLQLTSTNTTRVFGRSLQTDLVVLRTIMEKVFLLQTNVLIIGTTYYFNKCLVSFGIGPRTAVKGFFFEILSILDHCVCSRIKIHFLYNTNFSLEIIFGIHPIIFFLCFIPEIGDFLYLLRIFSTFID